MLVMQLEVVHQIRQQILNFHEFSKNHSINNFFQSMSMNLQRGNALCVMGTVAHHRKLEEIYNLGTISTQEE